MSQLASKLEGVRVKLAAAAPKIMTDTCDLVTTTSTPDGYGGSTEVSTVVEADVPCTYEAMTTPIQRQIGGGVITTLTHIITMPATAITKVIRPHYQIVIKALNDQPELIFRKPVTLDGSFSVFTELAAELAE